MNDEEVFDVENAPMNGEYLDQPDETPPEFGGEGVTTQAQLDEWIADGNIWGQEMMGIRRVISVMLNEDEERMDVMLDGKEISPKGLIEPLLEASALFGSFSLAVDEYKDGSKKKFAISQALVFKGVDLSRTIAGVRISAGRELYGFLVNRGEGDRFILLKTAKSAKEKKALENPLFFGLNFGYNVS